MTNIELLFTCPHGGKNDDESTTNPPIIRRVSTHFPDHICPIAGGQGFNNVNDALTLELTEEIIKNIKKLSGKDPYKEIA